MRKDQDVSERDTRTLRLPATLDCTSCDALVDHEFDAGEGVYDLEDLIDAPVEDVTCPSCGTTDRYEYGGWVAHSDAG